jgi:enamine deaminase RidA (YjgF/YER057c/UK114 family)
MGDKGGDNRPASFAHHLANYYHQQTAGLTNKAVRRGEMVMGSGKQQQKFFDKHVLGNPVYERAAQQSMEPVRTTIEDQYGRAKENIIANMPSGGTMLSTLMGVDMDRGQQLGNMEAQNQARLNQLAQSMWADELSRAYGLASMNPSQSMGALGAAAAAQAQQNAAQSGGKFGAMGDIGLALGMIGTGFLPGIGGGGGFRSDPLDPFPGG